MGACLMQTAEVQTHAMGKTSETRSMRDRLVRLAFRFVWNQHDAEDLAQETLATAHSRQSDLRDESKRWAWMCQILIQRLRLQARKRHLWQKHTAAYAEQRRQEETDSVEGSSAETNVAVRNALRDLPPRQYEVIVLRHLQSLSFDEIAEVLGIASSTARVHARSGREALRSILLRRESSRTMCEGEPGAHHEL